MSKYQLNQIATVTSGQSFRTAVHDDAAGKTRVIQLRDIVGTEIDAGSLARTSDAARDEHLVQPGDVIVRTRGAMLSAAMAPAGDSQFIIAAPLARIRLTSTEFRPEFACWFLNLPSTQRNLLASTQGSVVAVLSLRSIANLEIPAVPLDKQDLITDMDKLIRKEEDLARQLTQNRQQLLESLALDYLATGSSKGR